MESPKQILQRHEGLRLKPYLDSVGKLTIGIGRNLDDVGISTEEALYMFDNDYIRHTIAVKTKIPFSVYLDPYRLGVLVNMSFNLGINGLLGFKNFLSELEKGNYSKAADEMLNSKWATQVGSRATELAGIIRGER